MRKWRARPPAGREDLSPPTDHDITAADEMISIRINELCDECIRQTPEGLPIDLAMDDILKTGDVVDAVRVRRHGARSGCATARFRTARPPAGLNIERNRAKRQRQHAAKKAQTDELEAFRKGKGKGTVKSGGKPKKGQGNWQPGCQSDQGSGWESQTPPPTPPPSQKSKGKKGKGEGKWW